MYLQLKNKIFTFNFKSKLWTRCYEIYGNRTIEHREDSDDEEEFDDEKYYHIKALDKYDYSSSENEEKWIRWFWQDIKNIWNDKTNYLKLSTNF
jgi:CRISPR/Cas system-associated protein Cas5 (RAMP superfamily)